MANTNEAAVEAVTDTRVWNPPTALAVETCNRCDYAYREHSRRPDARIVCPDNPDHPAYSETEDKFEQAQRAKAAANRGVREDAPLSPPETDPLPADPSPPGDMGTRMETGDKWPPDRWDGDGRQMTYRGGGNWERTFETEDTGYWRLLADGSFVPAAVEPEPVPVPNDEPAIAARMADDGVPASGILGGVRSEQIATETTYEAAGGERYYAVPNDAEACPDCGYESGCPADADGFPEHENPPPDDDGGEDWPPPGGLVASPSGDNWTLGPFRTAGAAMAAGEELGFRTVVVTAEQATGR